MDRIFSPFFTTKPQGSGLGLAIVRKIVDAHDGRIDVSARVGGGTRFRVTLPVSGQHALFR
jgi:signal transduction histidine kinase